MLKARVGLTINGLIQLAKGYLWLSVVIGKPGRMCSLLIQTHSFFAECF